MMKHNGFFLSDVVGLGISHQEYNLVANQDGKDSTNSLESSNAHTSCTKP